MQELFHFVLFCCVGRQSSSQLEEGAAGQTLRIGGVKLHVSNLDKVLFPAGKFTKADLIKFYAD